MNVDLRDTTIAKSDQMNSDDLMGGAITITIRDVTKKDGEKDQPICIFYNGDDNKPWKPCKSMRRVLLKMWGHDGKSYVGRQITLFRDENVMWGSDKVGGIRISHMSHIDGEQIMSLTATRGSKKQFKVKPLETRQAPPPVDPARASELKQEGDDKAQLGTEEWRTWFGALTGPERVALKGMVDAWKAAAAQVDSADSDGRNDHLADLLGDGDRP